jgi:hypothetical protein
MTIQAMDRAVSTAQVQEVTTEVQSMGEESLMVLTIRKSRQKSTGTEERK